MYVLVVDKAWARLYRAGKVPDELKLVYHQALFGGRRTDENSDEELARSLCRLLRADRQGGKFRRLVMIAADTMREALRRQYDGDWADVAIGRIEDLPVRYDDADLGVYLRRLLAREQAANASRAATNLAHEKG